MALRLQVRNEWCRRVQAARLPRRKAAPAPGLQVRGPITAAYRHPRHAGGALHLSPPPLWHQSLPGHEKKNNLGPPRLIALGALDPRAGFEWKRRRGALYDGGNAQFWSAWSGGASCRGCRQDDCVWRLLLDHQGRLPRVLGAVRRAGRVRAHVCTRWPVGLTALSLRSCSVLVISTYVFSCSSVHAHACGVSSRTP